MTSQLDLDQSGTSRQWQRVYMGPSIGWLDIPGQNLLPVTAAAADTRVSECGPQPLWRPRAAAADAGL